MKSIYTVVLLLILPGVVFSAQGKVDSSFLNSTKCLDTLMRYSESPTYKYGDKGMLVEVNRAGYVIVKLRNGSTRVVDRTGSCITPSKQETMNYDQTLIGAFDSYRNINPKGFQQLLPVCKKEEGDSKWFKAAIARKDSKQPPSSAEAVR